MKSKKATKTKAKAPRKELKRSREPELGIVIRDLRAAVRQRDDKIASLEKLADRDEKKMLAEADEMFMLRKDRESWRAKFAEADEALFEARQQVAVLESKLAEAEKQKARWKAMGSPESESPTAALLIERDQALALVKQREGQLANTETLREEAVRRREGLAQEFGEATKSIGKLVAERDGVAKELEEARAHHNEEVSRAVTDIQRLIEQRDQALALAKQREGQLANTERMREEEARRREGLTQEFDEALAALKTKEEQLASAERRREALAHRLVRAEETPVLSERLKEELETSDEELTRIEEAARSLTEDAASAEDARKVGRGMLAFVALARRLREKEPEKKEDAG